MKKWMIGIILVSLVLVFYANWAETQEESTLEENPPEIISLSVGGIDVTAVYARELALDDSNLEAGNIVITGLISKTEVPLAGAKISLDGGQSWDEVNIQADRFTYKFKPEEAQEYKPRFKVVDKEGAEVDIRDIPEFSLIYKSVEFRQAIEGVLQEMVQAYSYKNLPGFTRHISDSFQGDIFALEEAVQSDFRIYDDINLDINIQQVIKSGDQARVDFRFEWYGVKKSDGSIVNPSTGTSNYLFVQEAGEYKLLAMAAPIIFGISEASEIATTGPGTTVDDTSETFTAEDVIVTPEEEEEESLTIYTAELDVFNEWLDFSTQSEGVVITDILYAEPGTRTIGAGGGDAQVCEVGTGTLEDYTEIPGTVNWVDEVDNAADGDVFGAQDGEDNYSLFEVTAIDNNHLNIRYKYQSDGTTSFP